MGKLRSLNGAVVVLWCVLAVNDRSKFRYIPEFGEHIERRQLFASRIE